MPKIFISYRRQDSAGYAGRIYDRLADHFGAETIFFDIDSIPPGMDFVEYIDRAIASSHVILVLMSNHWLDLRDGNGNRRIDDPHDFVHLEIYLALQHKKFVIPVLVNDTPMPMQTNLPENIQSLSRRNAYNIGNKDFHYDIQKLIEAIEWTFGTTPTGAMRAISGPPVEYNQPAKVKTYPPIQKPLNSPSYQTLSSTQSQASINSHQQELVSAFNFTPQELALNRDNRLSQHQIEVVTNTYKREGLYFLIFGSVLLLIAFWVFSINLLIAIIPCFFGVSCLAGSWSSYSLLDKKLYIHKIVGTAKLKDKKLIISSKKLDVDRFFGKELQNLIHKNTIYAAYYVDSGFTGLLLSIEPLPD